MSSLSSRSASEPLPLLFGHERRTLGWQGLTLPVPESWNPGKFSGKHASGDLRVDDENGVRLELHWETPRGTPNVEKSVEGFLARLEKAARKSKTEFARVEDAKVVARSRKKKDGITNFGWEGEPSSGAPCGFGTAWHCPVCERVVFAHVVGQRGETPRKIERLAGEILNDLECHGEGGWETWSVFDVQVDVPNEFELSKAQLLLNKIEIEWIRPRPNSLYGWGRRAERLKLTRFPVANVLLTGRTLEEWAEHQIREKNKFLSLGEAEETTFRAFEAVRFHGAAKDLKSRFAVAAFDRILRRRTPPGEVLVWHDFEANRIFAFENEVSHVNRHVPHEVLDTLVSR